MAKGQQGVTYAADKRVERDGVLIAYAGEVMTRDEAERRGLIKDAPAQASKPGTGGDES